MKNPSPSAPELLDVYAFDKADRLRKALRISGITSKAMATHLEVSDNTVSNWINGRAEPRYRDLRGFALRSGVPMEWLETGTITGGPDDTPSESEGKITIA